MRLSVTLVFLASLFTSPVVAGSELPTTGEGLYEIGCAKCHGKTGTGVPLDQVGFDVPLPDLSDCSFAMREPDFDWIAVSQRQHVLANVGVLVPMDDESPRQTQVFFYLLWEWFDGGLFGRLVGIVTSRSPASAAGRSTCTACPHRHEFCAGGAASRPSERR